MRTDTDVLTCKGVLKPIGCVVATQAWARMARDLKKRAQASRADFAACGRREGPVQVVRAVLGRGKDGEVEPRAEHVVPAKHRQQWAHAIDSES